MNFKFPDSASFTSKIKAVYSLDITMYKNDIIALQIADFPEIALKRTDTF